MPRTLRNGLGAAALVLVVATPQAAAMGVLPNCLDQLTKRTRSWSVCTHEFDRDARECRQSTQNMWTSMEECRRKGYSKAEIDRAMAEGASSAGQPVKPAKPATPAPAPRPRSGPIPGVDAPRDDSDD